MLGPMLDARDATSGAAMNQSEDLVQLPPQLWVDWHGSGLRPDARHLQPVGDDPNRRPSGGLWTSTAMPDGYSAYVLRMRELLGPYTPSVARPAWLLSPAPARVFVVEDRLAEADLAILAPTTGPDVALWPQMAARFDAVHMTEGGARSFWRQPAVGEPNAGERTRVLAFMDAQGFGSPLDWWETESTMWMHWSFFEAERLEDIDVPMMPNAAGQLPPR